MIKHRYLSGLVLLLLSSLLFGCTSAPAEAVIQIGTRTVTVDEFQDYLKLHAQEFINADPNKTTPEQIREDLFNRLVLAEVATNEANLNGIGVDSNFNTLIPAQIGAASGQAPATFKELQQYAQQNQFKDVEALRKSTVQTYVLNQYARTVDLVTPSVAKKQVQFRYLAVINVLVDPNFTPDPTIAQKLLDRIKAGEDLEAVALEAQADPAISDGQDVRVQTENINTFLSLSDVSSVMGSEAALAMSDLPLNQTSNIITINVPANSQTQSPPLLVWLVVEVFDRITFESWDAMLQDGVGVQYLNELANLYQVEGRMRLYPERIQSIPLSFTN